MTTFNNAMQPFSPTAKKITSPEPQEESAELRRFREEWKLELKRRAAQSEVLGQDPGTASTGSLSQESSGSKPVAELPTFPRLKTPFEPYFSKPVTSGASTQARTTSVHLSTTPSLSRALESAVAIYRQAIQCEQRGEFDEALALYRQAFRLDPNVDRTYQHEENRTAAILALQQESVTQGGAHTTPAGKAKIVHGEDGPSLEGLPKRLENTLSLQDHPLEHGKIASGATKGSLASIVDRFPQTLVFEPEDEHEPVPLNRIPDEVIIYILKILDPRSIERFAAVNRKARVVTLDTSIWRELVNATYKPPQIPDLLEGDILTQLLDQYLYDYRRLYIEHPRVRMDGVYIAVCHYIRPGLSENSWVNVTHLITYHRYLRFFPNGQVMSLLTNEEHPPVQVIQLLKPTLRGMKGLYFGNWHLSGNTIILSNLVDASSRSIASVDFSSPSSVAALIQVGRGTSTGELSTSHSASSSHAYGHGHGHSSSIDHAPLIRYIFTMNLTLRSRPIGRWNKLDIESYDSVNLETGDATPVALKHERPFWFSKVRSYAA